MPNRRLAPVAGRPSKGVRKLLSSRVPVDLADKVYADAARYDLSYSEHVANIVAAYYGEPPIAQPRVSPDDELPLTA